MTKLKFFNPKIDKQSLMHSYDYAYLAKAKELFGITDVWATYSWGFSSKTEKEDYKFFASKVKNFKKLGLKLHAYIQGPTVVYSEFPDVGWYCKDNRGRDIWYYRGRKMVCINNPNFVEFVKSKIEDVSKLNVDGVFIDNIVMGQLPVPIFINKLPFVFAGCYCQYCQNKFRKERNSRIPTDLEKDAEITREYLNWRADCVTQFLTQLSSLAHEKNLLFGSNSYDPYFLPKYTYGIRSGELDKIQDYHLFESLSFPNKVGTKSAKYIERLTKKLSKPVFVVSYKYGVGLDKEFSQDDMDTLYSEQWKERLHIGIKGSEYVTKGIWHNLYLEHFDKPDKNKPYRFHTSSQNRYVRRLKNIVIFWPMKQFVKYFYNPTVRLIMEKKFARYLATHTTFCILVISRNYKQAKPLLKKYGLFLLILVSLTITYNLFLNSSNFLQLTEGIKQNLFLAISFLIGLKILGLVWPPFSGGIVAFLLLPIFGVFNTYLIDLAGTIIGITVSYFIAKWLNRKLVTALVGNTFIEKVSRVKIKEERELEAVILASIVLAGPMIEVVSYAAGFLKVKYRNLLVGILIGHSLWTLPAFFVVNSLIFQQNLIISVFVIAVGLLLMLKLRKRYITFFESEQKKG